LTKIVYLKINPIYLSVQFDKIFQQFLSRLLTLTISVDAVIMTRRSPSISWLILAGAPWPKMRRRREYRQPRSTAIAEDRGKGQTRLVHYRGRKSSPREQFARYSRGQTNARTQDSSWRDSQYETRNTTLL